MTNVHTLSQTMVNLGGSLAHVVKCIQQIVYLFLCAHLLLRIIQLRHAQQIKETDSCEAAACTPGPGAEARGRTSARTRRCLFDVKPC